MSYFSFALDGPIAASAATQHPFLERLARSDGASLVTRTFASEYSVLRRTARALDAGLTDSHDAYRDFLQSIGLIGSGWVDADSGWVDTALPATRGACEDLQGLIRSRVLRSGALWALERVGSRWAQSCSGTHWGASFWAARTQVGEALVPDPLDEASRDREWVQGRDAALLALTTWLDALEQLVTDKRVA